MANALPVGPPPKVNEPTALLPVMQASEQSPDHLSHPVGYEPLDWGAAVRAAAVILDGPLGPSGEVENLQMAHMAQDLAARLCAYGGATDTGDHGYPYPAAAMQPDADPKKPATPSS